MQQLLVPDGKAIWNGIGQTRSVLRGLRQARATLRGQYLSIQLCVL